MDKTSLPEKVFLTGSDCFHLVLDKHARTHQAGGNTMRIVFYFNQKLDAERIRKALGLSPLIHWLCNIQLRQGSLFSPPFWQYRDKGNEIRVIEHQHAETGAIPAIILERDIPLDAERFIEGDLIDYPNNQSVLVLSWNHILMDGKGIGMLIQHLNDLGGGKPMQPVESFFPAPEKKTGLISPISNMYRVKAFIEASSREPISSVASRNAKSINGFKNSILRFTGLETKQINENAVQNGARFGANLYYLSCCIQAVNQINKKRKKEGAMWIPVPYDGRLRGSLGPVISNTVAFLFYRIPPAELASVKQTLSSLSAQMTEQIKNQMPVKYSRLLNLMRHIPLGLYYFLVNKRGRGSFASFLYSSTGENFNQVKTLFGETVEHLSIFPSPTFPPGLTFSFLKHRDALNINMAYSPDIINPGELGTIEIELRNLLLENRL